MSKNVFLIPTEKESNLFKNLNYDLEVKEPSLGNRFEVNQYIYITDEEATPVDGYYLRGVLENVVLTNDPSLIANGVQEIEKSILISFAENPVDYLEVTRMLQTRWGTEWHDLPNQAEGRETDGIYRHIYRVNFPQKEHQILTDLKDYFKNTSPEKIQSDWEETKEESPKNLEQIIGEAMFKQADFVYHPQTEIVKLLNEFEMLEGVPPSQFDEKDWARFERFVKAKAEDEEENWQFERSSGYAGYRNKVTNEWIYERDYSEKFGEKRVETTEKLYTEEEVLEQLNLLYTMKNSTVDTFTDEDDKITMKWFENLRGK